MQAKNIVCKWLERNVRLFSKSACSPFITEQARSKLDLDNTVPLQSLQTVETASTDNQSQFSMILSRLRNVVGLFLATTVKGRFKKEICLVDKLIHKINSKIIVGSLKVSAATAIISAVIKSYISKKITSSATSIYAAIFDLNTEFNM